MLYDLRWAKRETLSSVIAWLEQKNPEKSYLYCDPNNCLAAQYHRAMGTKYRPPFPLRWLWSRAFDVNLEKIAFAEPRTFGAALTRARAMERMSE